MAGGELAGGEPPGGELTGGDAAVPPVPLAMFGVAVTGMLPCAIPFIEVAVATVVAVPT